ncbi:MAG TPA: LysM peptidoglycan-binding domain-containing protein [Aggregatilineales bacterium]|nr:LysM peptidoglycan-binding domain-containing protein [Aggregatilineales bacterium]
MRRFALILAIAFLVGLPTASSMAQTATPAPVTTYTVQAGDHLFRIALRFGVTTSALAAYNGIVNPDLIFTGQVLKIPPGGTTVPASTPAPGTTATPVPSSGGGQVGTYTVQQGDTLSALAARYGTTVAAISALNGIVNPNLIFVGQVLKIPGATGSGSTSGGGSVQPSTVSGFDVGGQVLGSFGGATLSAMQQSKMHWVKFQISAGDQNAPNLISQAHASSFKILLSVIGDQNGVTNSAYQDSYAVYVGGVAQAGADAIEVWNEENIDREWPTGQVSPNTYEQLLSKSFNAIKGKNGNTLVISGALAPTGFFGGTSANGWDDDVYYQGMAAAGAASVADCIGVHYNEGIVSPLQTSGDPRDNYPTRYLKTQLSRAMVYFPGKMACFTELGYLSPEGYGALPAAFSWAANTTVAEQALWLSQAAQVLSSSGRARLMVVFNVDATQFTPDPQAGYAMIRPGGSCPACSSLASVLP